MPNDSNETKSKMEDILRKRYEKEKKYKKDISFLSWLDEESYVGGSVNEFENGLKEIKKSFTDNGIDPENTTLIYAKCDYNTTGLAFVPLFEESFEEFLDRISCTEKSYLEDLEEYEYIERNILKISSPEIKDRIRKLLDTDTRELNKRKSK